MDLATAKVIGISAALGVSASWAAGAILFGKLGENLSPLAMTLVKGAISLVLLGAASVGSGFSGVDAHSMALLALSGGIGIALGDTFFFQALKDLGPALIVVLIMLGQVLTAALGIIFLRESLTWMKGAGIALVVGGVGLVMSAKLTGERQPSHVRGIIFGLLSVVCMAVAGLVTKLALKEDSDTMLATFIRMVAGTMLMFIFGVATRQVGRWVIPFQDRTLAARFVLATTVVTFGGFWLTTVAFKYAELSVANTLSSVEPLFVLPLAAIFCNERVTWSAIVGTAVAVAGIVLLVSFQPI